MISTMMVLTMMLTYALARHTIHPGLLGSLRPQRTLMVTDVEMLTKTTTTMGMALAMEAMIVQA